jgi:hypothetical protein
MEDETVEPTGMLQKKPEDLTTGEVLKIQGVATAIGLGIPLVIGGAWYGWERFSDWRRTRKLNTIENVIDIKEK